MSEANGAPKILTAEEILAACTGVVETSLGLVRVRRISSGELASIDVMGPIIDLPKDEIASRLGDTAPTGFLAREDLYDAVCVLGMTEPRASFEGKPGTVPVRVLGNDRTRIFMTIMRLSGFSAEAGAAASFRDREGNGEPAPGAVVEETGAPA